MKNTELNFGYRFSKPIQWESRYSIRGTGKRTDGQMDRTDRDRQHEVQSRFPHLRERLHKNLSDIKVDNRGEECSMRGRHTHISTIFVGIAKKMAIDLHRSHNACQILLFYLTTIIQE